MRFLWILAVSGCTFIGGGHHADRIDEVCAADPTQAGCTDDPPPTGTVDCFTDGDEDGHGAGEAIPTDGECAPGTVLLDDDCDDGDAAVLPGAEEICGNGVDDDCVGGDEAGDTLFVDADGDGYGTGSAVAVCAGTPGYSDVGGDCDDVLNGVNPGATESPADGIDQDCDGTELCPVDVDGDGFESLDGAVIGALGCPAPALVDTDCDDGDPDVFPGAVEGLADGVDQNCDGLEQCYEDADQDGYGDLLTDITGVDCDADPFASSVGGDCDDTDPTSNPGEVEDCNDNIDHDCNGDPIGGTWYLDGDLDGWGDTATLNQDCVAPGVDWVTQGGDCNDADGAIFPGAGEGPADGIDHDCDGLELCYVDTDGDAFGDGTALGSLACDQPGEALVDGDCDDDCATCFPANPEVCDGLDNDCAGGVDDGASDPTTWYPDGDGDGYGAGTGVDACTPPSGHAGTDTDCNDADPDVNPGVAEVCGNGIDDNCDPADDASGASWYVDGDGDGQGAGTPTVQCTQPPGQVANDLDCDDANGAIFDGNTAVTVGDAIDDDCDGNDECWADPDDDGYAEDGLAPEPGVGLTCGAVLAGVDGDCAPIDPAINPGATETADNAVDEDCDQQLLCYFDSDFDNYGDDNQAPTLTAQCSGGFAINGGDCNDGNGAINPGAVDLVGDALDQDCSGLWTCRPDVDSDTYTGNGIVEIASPCAPSTPGDCDDLDPLSFPGATEICDGLDNNCDGGLPPNEADGDSDTYVQCAPYVGAVVGISGGGDCDDMAAAVNPAAAETVGNNVDEDCDSRWLCYLDGDLDTFGGPATNEASQDCAAAGRSVNNADCDDSNPLSNPGAVEICDGLDNDCDLVVPPGEQDDDTDSYVECPGWVGSLSGITGGGDCDDTRAVVNPGALEVCDNLDNDCNAVTSEANLISIGLVNHPNLQSAANGAGNNAVINVCGGSHPLFLNYPNNLEIVGIGSQPVLNRNAANDRILETDSSVTFRNVVIDGGGFSFVDDGACLYLPDDGSVDVTDSIIRNCRSNGDGGGLFLANAAVATLDNVAFEGNSAGSDGAGIYGFNQDGLSLTDVDFSSNIAGSRGGGVCSIASDVLASGGSYTDNEAFEGAGMFVGRDFTAGFGALTADSLTFTSNVAGSSGGGLFLDGSAHACNTCQFNSNESQDFGQAVALRLNNASLTMQNCSVFGHGPNPIGALHVMSGSAPNYTTMTLTSCNVFDNEIGVQLDTLGSQLIVNSSDFNRTPDNNIDVMLYDFTVYDPAATGFLCQGSVCL